jgi:hypothetical protein
MRIVKIFYIVLFLFLANYSFSSLFNVTNTKAKISSKDRTNMKAKTGSGITTSSTYTNAANSTDEVTAQIESTLAATLSSLASTSSTLANSLSSQAGSIEAAKTSFLSAVAIGGTRSAIVQNYQKRINKAIILWKHSSSATKRAAYAKMTDAYLDSCGTTSGTGCTYDSSYTY